MSIIMIVNLIISFSLTLAGSEMRKRSRRFDHKSIGFRTPVTLKDDEAWEYANYKCGMLWMFIGGVAVFLIMTSAIRFRTIASAYVMQSLILIIMTAGAVLSVKMVIADLNNKFNDQR